jgi:hypothetical protein
MAESAAFINEAASAIANGTGISRSENGALLVATGPRRTLKLCHRDVGILILVLADQCEDDAKRVAREVFHG